VWQCGRPARSTDLAAGKRQSDLRSFTASPDAGELQAEPVEDDASQFGIVEQFVSLCMFRIAPVEG
jgi:hypothetical protein